MFNDQKILRDIFTYCMYDGLIWELVNEDNRVQILSSKDKVTKNKYLSFIIYAYKKNGIIDVNNIKLEINLISKRGETKLKVYLSRDYPMVIDIYDILDILDEEILS